MNTNIIDKVLIIDDIYEEAMPIIQALSKKGISTIYWNGHVTTKPEHPLDNIRLVILDMRFSSVTNPRDIFSNLFTLLKHSISDVNGPYILFIWSKHDNEYLKEFKDELEKTPDVPQPYLITNMEKSKYIKTITEENEIYNQLASTLEDKQSIELQQEILEIIENMGINTTKETIILEDDIVEKLVCALEDNLAKVNSLSILLMWENLIKKSANKLVNNIANFSEFSGTWDNNIKTLIQHLAIAHAGKSIGTTAKEYIINSMYALNQMFPDEISSQLIELSIDEDKFNFINSPSIGKNIDGDIYSISKPNKKIIIKKNNLDYESFKNISDIKDSSNIDICKELYTEYLNYLGTSNFKFLCERITHSNFKKPGGIYLFEDFNMLDELSDFTFKNKQDIPTSSYSLVKLDISSSCDYAQNKLKKIRLLFGIMIENPYYISINNTDDIYCTPELNIDGKIVKIVFNFNYITHNSKDNIIASNKLFSFRELFLTEIKHKLSTYISRVGIINL